MNHGVSGYYDLGGILTMVSHRTALFGKAYVQQMTPGFMIRTTLMRSSTMTSSALSHMVRDVFCVDSDAMTNCMQASKHD